MYIIIENLEVISISETPHPTLLSIFVPKDFIVWSKTTHVINGEIIISHGKTFTMAELAQLQTLGLERLDRLQHINDELSSLIGLNVLSLTEPQRWKLVAAVFYKLGVINSSGIVNEYSDWLDL